MAPARPVAAPPPGGRLRIVSHFPGRLRVRAEAFRDRARADAVAEAVRAAEGVTRVETAPLTGSVLVLYEARRVQVPWLVQLVVRAGELDGVQADHDGAPWQPSGPAVRALLDRWNQAAVTASRGRVDTRTAVPGTLATLGVARLLFGPPRLPEWYDLLFWSFVTFVNLNPPGAATPAADGAATPATAGASPPAPLSDDGAPR